MSLPFLAVTDRGPAHLERTLTRELVARLERDADARR
jgi:hypothetical protein